MTCQLVILGSFRLQSTCRYQRSREDVCPQHKATGHVSKYVNSRCAIENCLMSARNIRATAHAPCSQHTFNRNLELKTDQFHGVLQTGDAIDLTSGRRAELKHEAVESWSDSHAQAPARQSACSQSYQGDFDCINVPLVNVVERMSARNVGATAHYVFVHWSTYNRKLPNVCPQHEGCCACAVFSTCAQILNSRLVSRCSRIGGAHRVTCNSMVAPLAVAGGWGAELKQSFRLQWTALVDVVEIMSAP